MHLRIGTRGSKLALKQTELFVELLCKHLEFTHEIKIIKTTGDKIQDIPLYDIGGKALFVKEIEQALKDNEIDLAVHSLKDVPGIIDNQFTLPFYFGREWPNDCIVSNHSTSIGGLKPGAKVGTSSPRRIAFLKHISPDLKIEYLRGNVETRLNKVHTGEYDAIILAEAGLKRLGLCSNICTALNTDYFIPAVGQGVVAVETIRSNVVLNSILTKLNSQNLKDIVDKEREFLAAINADCDTPVAGHIKFCGEKYIGSFMLANSDFSKIKEIRRQYNLIEDVNGAKIASELLQLIRN